MKTSWKRAGASLTAAVLAGSGLAVANTDNAQAATLYADCATTGAWGDVYVSDFYGSTDKIKLSMDLQDMRADNHHVRIRLVTSNYEHRLRYWRWHAYTGGKAGPGLSIYTTATDSSGIFGVAIQVARFEGSTELNRCMEWTEGY